MKPITSGVTMPARFAHRLNSPPVTPTASFGFHYGFDAWQRSNKSSSVTVNGVPTGLAYVDYWGKVFHAEAGLQWMARNGFTAEFNAGPMLFLNPRTNTWDWFGFFSLGIGWYFH